jgi:DNA invertase Pin-like site-specific DNA recombinase
LPLGATTASTTPRHGGTRDEAFGDTGQAVAPCETRADGFLTTLLKTPHAKAECRPCKPRLLRVSTTNGQTTENQRRELEAVAARLGHSIVAVFEDNGISGAKGRDKRPAFDRLHKAIARREFDLVMAWSVDRLGRSLQDLCGFLGDLHAKGIGLYLHVQGVDTTTPAGKAMFQMLGVFAEFERSMIRDRVVAGLVRAKAKGTKSGKPIGRPSLPEGTRRAIREAYARKEGGYGTLAKRFGVAIMTVRKCLVD